MMYERDIVINSLLRYVRDNDDILIPDEEAEISELCDDIEHEDIQLDFDKMDDWKLFWIYRAFYYLDREYQYIRSKICEEYDNRNL